MANTMRTIGWSILLLSFAVLASARVPKKCSAPPEYLHTRLDSKFTSRQTFSSGEKVRYKCDEDFTSTKGSWIVQCNDGRWSKLTLKCEKRSCGNAGDLPNGQFKYEGNAYVGEKVHAICNEGYTVKGLNYMICKKSGWTGEFPSCEEGATTCSTPAVANSEQRGGDVSVYRLGDNVTFTCSQGFQLDGAQQITCGPGGQWQPGPPQCLPSPAAGCDVPLPGKNANLADKYITMTSFNSGDQVYYMCDVGYAPTGGSRGRQCYNGEWTALTLKCERKRCGHAGEISNGWFVYTGSQFGDTATAVCDEGYGLVGRATRTCTSKGWDGRVPVCEAVECEDPPKVANAVRKGPQEPPYLYRSVVSYQCRVGTLVGQKEIWCTENGTWSAPAPTCKVITCPPPNVLNAYWMGGHKQVFQHRETISIECNLGYVMTGPSTITCGANGRWSGLPRCQRTSRRYRG